MLELFDGDHLATDLDNLRSDPSILDDADLIDAFLDQLAESEDALWSLVKWKGSHHNPYFNCSAIDCFQNEGYNVYRIRPQDGRLNKYRIIYAFDGVHNDFYLLAIVIKSPTTLQSGPKSDIHYNYEPSHPITRRVKSEYDRLGLPRLNG